MAKDLFVKRYKGVADNDSLDYFDTLVIHVGNKYTATNDTQQIGFGIVQGTPAFKIKATGGGTFKYRFNDTPDSGYSEYVNEVTVPEGTFGVCLYVAEGTYDIFVGTLYGLRNLNYGRANQNSYKNAYFDFSKLNYCPFENIWTSGIPATGVYDPKVVGNINEALFNLYNINAQGDPAKFSYKINIEAFKNATSITKIVARDTQAYGSIETLGGCTSLVELTLAYTDVSGEVTVLADRQVAAGRTSGVLRIGVIPTNCTLNGNPISYASLDNHWNIFIVFNPQDQGGYHIQYTEP